MRGMRRERRWGVALLLLPLLAGGCIPYTVGTTARPVAQGQSSKTLSIFPMPRIGRIDSTKPVSAIGMDAEWRAGVSPTADIGVRVASGSGFIINYKQLLTDTASTGVQMAVMPGAGFINMGSHAHFELTLLASGYESSTIRHDTTFTPTFVPYGGLRVMQVAPIQEGAVHDDPTIGVFLGARIGKRDLGVSPEIGVFYDRSALGLRKTNIVFVPALSVHGDRFINEIFDLIGMSGILGTTGRRRIDDGPVRDVAPPRTLKQPRTQGLDGPPTINVPTVVRSTAAKTAAGRGRPAPVVVRPRS